MIVISGVLVLVALVLLIIGVVGPDLSFVYASIGVSLVSLVFLVIGILQRRGDTATADSAAAPAPEVAQEPVDGATVVPSPSARASMRRSVEQAPVAETAADQAPGSVLVVEGRPRYHVEGCRYLYGKDVEEPHVLDAREEGFTPCGVCKPDDALAAGTPAPVAASAEEAAPAPVVEEDVPGIEVSATRTLKVPASKTPARKAAAKKAPAKAAPVTPVKAAAPAPAPAAAPKVAPAKAPTKAATKAPTKAPVKAPVKAATKAPVKAPATVPAPAPVKAPVKAPTKVAPSTVSAKAPVKAPVKAPATAPDSAATKPGSVVVIPDRGKYHRADCRYVRDVDGAEVLTKSAATRQGYAACGVCKP